MTDHGKEESEREEASGSKGKARSCEEERRQEEGPLGKEGEQSEGSHEGQEGKEGGSEESTREVCEGCAAGEGCSGSEESDGTAEARGPGRTGLPAGARSHAGQRFRTRRPAAAVDDHGSFRLAGIGRLGAWRASAGEGCAPRCRREREAAREPTRRSARGDAGALARLVALHNP